MSGPFQIGHVVAVANKHPYYTSHEYPLTPEEVAEVVAKEPSSNCTNSLLSKCPITQKEDIYKAASRLFADDSPRNAFRQHTYISLTGGGSGTSVPLPFLTDIGENRTQRKDIGELLGRLEVVGKNDCVLSMHSCGRMYRALDLLTEIIEHAGASVLPVGHLASPEDILAICNSLRPNALTGDASQIVNFASFVASAKDRGNLRITKILYTSEPMTRLQRSYVQSVFGHEGQKPVEFSSLFGSAEMGAFAIGNFALTGPQVEDTADFIFDVRHMVVEVLPLDFDFTADRECPCSLVENEVGSLVVTSLQRLRNPLVRYLTGDIGSVYQLPPSAASQLGEASEHLRVLRVHGRDIRRSFKWQGEYFEFGNLRKIMSDPAWGVMKWQIVLTSDALSNRESLDLRLMRMQGTEGLVTQEALEAALQKVFCIHVRNESLFHVKLATLDDFIRSATGNKIIMFVDKRDSSLSKV